MKKEKLLSLEFAIKKQTKDLAEQFHMHDRGTIEVGKRADLIVVEGDPLTDSNALARPRWVIRNGDLRSPKEWLQN